MFVKKFLFKFKTDGMIGCFSGMQATPLPCFKAERALKSKKYISKT